MNKQHREKERKKERKTRQKEKQKQQKIKKNDESRLAKTRTREMPVIKQRKMSRFKVSTKYQRNSGGGGGGGEGKPEE